MTKQLLHTGLQAVMTNRAYFRPHFIKGFVVVFVLLIFFFSFGSGPVQSLGHKRYGAATDLESNIANSTLGFGKIYVVNLPARTDRRDTLVLMAAVTGLELEFIPARTGEEVADKALIPPATRSSKASGAIGCWRSHLDAISRVVENNLDTALILEDDIDWDLNITKQMFDFAKTTRALTQPLYGSSSYADPSFVNPTEYEGQPPDLDFDKLPPTEPPKISPYGDNWDVLWMGHCGAKAPNVNLQEDVIGRELSRAIPRGRVVHYNDETVAESHYLHTIKQEFDPRKLFPDHTRVTHHTLDLYCTFSYAVSQRGARRILYEAGLRKFDIEWDLLLRDICNGDHDRPKKAVCLTVEPGLFHMYRGGRISSLSNISPVNDDKEMEKPFSVHIRYSARLNLPNLLSEMTPVYDQYPDKNESS